MNFTYYDLGNLAKGQIVQVILQGNSANVRLLDSTNFNSYKNGRRHRYYGGHAKKSPVLLPVPHNGHWYVTVDLGGYPGRVKSAVNILSGPLPNIKQPSLADIPSLLFNENADNSNIEYDVFISHASEDKNDIVRPLAIALQAKNIKVWYDEFEMRIGDSLRRKIDKGLANSRFGIVVISRDFIKKGWTNYELDGIMTRAISGEQILLPIWHNITKEEVVNYSPSLADKVARNTTDNTVEEIAEEIANLINSQ